MDMLGSRCRLLSKFPPHEVGDPIDRSTHTPF